MADGVSKELCDERSGNIARDIKEVKTKLDKVMFLLIASLITLTANLLVMYADRSGQVQQAIHHALNILP